MGTVFNGVLLNDTDSVSAAWNQAEDNIHTQIGNEGDMGPDTINGNLNILKKKMTEIKNYQNTEFNIMLGNLNTFTRNWEDYYKRQVMAIDELIAKMRELENEQYRQLDNSPDVTTADQGGNNPEFSGLPQTNPPTTTTPTGSTGGTPTGGGGTLPFDDNIKKQLAGAIINGYDSSGWGTGSARKSNIDLIYGPGAGQ